MNHETRKAMEFIRDQFAGNEARLNDHIFTTFRWLMATLFVANGGAIVALMSGEKTWPGEFYAAAWFFLGVVWTFLMGAASTIFSLKAVMAMAQMRARMEEGLARDQDMSAEVVSFFAKQKSNWKTWIPTYLGLLSLAFFIIGAATIAGSLLRGGFWS